MPNFRDPPNKKLAYGCNCYIIFVALFLLIGSFAGLGGAGDLSKLPGSWKDISKKSSPPFVCEAPKPCPSTEWVEKGSSCYLLDKNVGKSDWYKAKKKCEAFSGGYLVKIDDQAENDFVFEMCDKLHDGCFIGLHQPSGGTGEFDWVWTDGSKPSYTNWWKGDAWSEPNDSGDGDAGSAKMSRMQRVAGGRRLAAERRLSSEEDAVGLFTNAEKSDIQGAVFFGALIAIVINFITLIVISVFVTFACCGIQSNNKCCIITAASGDGFCAGCNCVCFGCNIMGANAIGAILFLFLCFGHTAQAIIQCWACRTIDQVQQMQQPAAATILGQNVQIAQPVQGQVMEGKVVAGTVVVQ
eukprot:TRINITY_DN18075_c0_g2_i1.p1 TRINITY_DN18075_c0_g2~~TRINITY_DN18075_c0_g2_i1.p1  ORF type:complete len:354 (-),score=36.96 TRINITY_DN18075_c0_g2_i1:171-1232(-)